MPRAPEPLHSLIIALAQAAQLLDEYLKQYGPPGEATGGRITIKVEDQQEDEDGGASAHR